MAVPPVQVPAWQVSPVVQNKPSMHGVPFDWNPSVGHAAADPVHVSATSHWPTDPRQVKLLAWKTSTHAALVPAQ